MFPRPIGNALGRAWPRAYLLALALALGAPPVRAAPLTGSARPLVPDGAAEALVRLRYARAAGAGSSGGPTEGRSERAGEQGGASGAGAGDLGLVALLAERLDTARDTRDPREFGFDPERAWRTMAGGPSEGAASGGAAIRERLRAYFQGAVSALHAPPVAGAEGARGPISPPSPSALDPVRMSLVPTLTVGDGPVASWDASLDDAALGGRTPGAIALAEQLRPDPDPASDPGALAPRRQEVIAGLGSLVPLDERARPGGGERGDAALGGTETEAISMREFARRVLAAIFTSPWLYLGLGGLGLARLLAVGLRRAR